MKIKKSRIIEIIKEELKKKSEEEYSGISRPAFNPKPKEYDSDMWSLDEHYEPGTITNLFKKYHTDMVKPLYDTIQTITSEHSMLMGKAEKLLDRISELEKRTGLSDKASGADIDVEGDTELAPLPDPGRDF